MNCGPASLNARTACARCLPRGSLPAITTWLLCQLANATQKAPFNPDLAGTNGNLDFTWQQESVPDFNIVERRLDSMAGPSGPWVVVATLPGAVTTYHEANLMVAQDIWYYRVRAQVGTGFSPYCVETGVSFNVQYPAGTVTIDLPNLVLALGSGIGGFRFDTIVALTSVTLPRLHTVTGIFSAFTCTNLTTLSAPNLRSVSQNMDMADLWSLAVFSFPILQTVGGQLLVDHGTVMQTIYLPSLLTVDQFDCNSCPNLTSIDLSSLIAATTSFNCNSCTSLPILNLPALADVGSVGFGACAGIGCTALAELHLPNVTFSGDVRFDNCTALTTLDLQNALFTDLGTLNIFSNCAIVVGDSATGQGVNGFLNRAVAGLVGGGGATYDISGGTNAIPVDPTGQTDKTTINLSGSFAITN